MPPDEVTIYPPASIPSRACRYYIFDANEPYAAAGWQEIDKNYYLAWMAAIFFAKYVGGELAKVRLLAIEQPEQ